MTENKMIPTMTDNTITKVGSIMEIIPLIFVFTECSYSWEMLAIASSIAPAFSAMVAIRA